MPSSTATQKGFTSLLPDLWREAPLAQTVFGIMDNPAGLTRLPAFGGRSIIADLNRDGYPDIVFCKYIHNYRGNRSAFIYWGGRTGTGAIAEPSCPLSGPRGSPPPT